VTAEHVLTLDERTTVQRARAGDRRALDSLLAAHSTPAYRFALQILRNQHDAEDATQAAFVKAFSKLNSFDQTRAFGPWLMGIVYHEALNLRRADTTRRAFWQRQPAPPSADDSAEAEALVRAEHRELWHALNRLKDDDRAVLILTSLMGYGEAEASEILGIKRGTLKSRKHNALRKLRDVVEKDFPGLAPEGAPERTRQ
jgi:RNA polymerase sigma-70 factor, ECF subfamily